MSEEPAPAAAADDTDDESILYASAEDLSTDFAFDAGDNVLPMPVDVEPAEPPDRTARRRADVDAKQAVIARILGDLGADGVVLLMPAHVAWFTGGMNVRGLIADGERPGVYTNGRQRWLLCSNIDTQRLFDEELDGLGFQLKEWQWGTGRAVLLGELVAGKKFATDRPFPNMPLINDKLRPELRPLTDYEREQYAELGADVAHALEATARNLSRGESEIEIAGQVAHRLTHRGVEPAGISVTADARGQKFRRAGATAAVLETYCTLQATATRDGLFATASRTVSFGPPADEFRDAFERAVKVSAVSRLKTVPGVTISAAAEAGRMFTANTAYEYDWRFSQPGYGAGRFPAEELRRFGLEEAFADGWPVVWQSRVGVAAVVDTVIVSPEGPLAVTPPTDWPYKKITIQGKIYVVPDLLVRGD